MDKRRQHRFQFELYLTADSGLKFDGQIPRECSDWGRPEILRTTLGYDGRMKALVLMWAAALAAVAQQPNRFVAAEKQVVRLSPTAFPELPRNISLELARRGCRIPQESSTRQPNNVIHGSFIKAGQMDWAVLCSIQDVSSILVFENGSAAKPAVVGRSEDLHYMQTISNDRIGFSRLITPAGKDFIMRHYLGYGGPTPPPIHHLGIDDAFVGKASITRYFYGGKWLLLSGAD